MVPALFERNAFDALRQGGVVLPFDRVVEKVAVDVYGQFVVHREFQIETGHVGLQQQVDQRPGAE